MYFNILYNNVLYFSCSSINNFGTFKLPTNTLSVCGIADPVFLLCINKDEQENLTHFIEALASLVTDVTFLNQLDHCEDFDSLNAFFSLASKQTSQIEESIFQ